MLADRNRKGLLGCQQLVGIPSLGIAQNGAGHFRVVNIEVEARRRFVGGVADGKRQLEAFFHRDVEDDLIAHAQSRAPCRR